MPGHLRLVVWIGLTAGDLHMGEICALRLGDIDLMDHIIHIKSNVVRRPISPGYELTIRPQITKERAPAPLSPGIGKAGSSDRCNT